MVTAFNFEGLFFDFTAFILTALCGTKVLIYSDTPDILSDDSLGLIISNHRCRVDWMYVGWFYAAITKSSNYLKIILKDALRYVPIFGWAAQILMFIFLERKKERDLPHIKRATSYLLHADKRVVMLIFPEGTDLSQKNLAKSREFSTENKLREYKQVLYPKPAGFLATVKPLRNQKLSIHDLTVAYKGYTTQKRPNEKDFLFGIFPSEVHILVRRHEIDSILDEENWLPLSFLKKEEELLQFESTGKLCADSMLVPYKHLYMNGARGMMLCIVLLSLLLVFSAWFRWLCAIYVVICVAMRAFNGFDSGSATCCVLVDL